MLPIAKTTSFLLFERLGRRGDRRVGEDQQRQLAPLLAGAELAEADQRRFLRQPLAEVDHVGVPRGGLVVARLGDGARRLGAGRFREKRDEEVKESEEREA